MSDIKLNNKYVMPTYENFEILKTGKYRIIELKKIAKKYNLKVSGKKQELINRIYNHLSIKKNNISRFDIVTKIKSLFKGYLVRKYMKLHGPYLYISKRDICVNDSDFLTLDCLKEIPLSQFITCTDKKGFTYGFDICSLHNFFKSQTKPFNPYTREEFSKEFIDNVKKIIRMSYVVNIPINITIEDPFINTQDPAVIIRLRVEKLCQVMDDLGNYTNSDWILNLNRGQMLKFICELKDIVEFRLEGLPNSVKCEIYPPNGDFFGNFNYGLLIYKETYFIHVVLISIIERFVLYGINDQAKSLGTNYVLMALTLVCPDAANALPFLYQSVV